MNDQKLFSKKNRQNILQYNLPFVVDENKIIGVVKNFLQKQSIESFIFEFCLDIKFSNLKPGDVLEVQNDLNEKVFFKTKNKLIIKEIIFFENFIKIFAHEYFSDLYNINSFSILFKNFEGKLNTNFLSQIKKNSKTLLKVTQTPSLNKQNFNFNGFICFFPIPAEGSLNWTGASIFKQEVTSSQTFIDQVQDKGIFGKILKMTKKSTKKISPLLIDFDSEIFIHLSSSFNLFNVSDEEFFAFKNLAKIGDEIISFKEVEYIQDRIYKIKILLRGLFGTESFIDVEKQNQEFFLIDQNLLSEKLAVQEIGEEVIYKAVSFGDTILEASDSKIFFSNIYSLQHTVCNLAIKKHHSEEFIFSFRRRMRVSYSVFSPDENFEFYQSVIFEKFNQPGQIQEIKVENSNAFLIRIFENKKKEKLLFENFISDLFFKFTLKQNYQEIYIEVLSLNSIYIDCFYISCIANLNDFEIYNIEYSKNF